MAARTRPFLVFSSVGPDSCHPLWLQGRQLFDLALVDYAGNCPQSPDYRLWRRPGAKWPNLGYALEQWPEMADYSVVAVLDDDLQLSGQALEIAFQLFEQHQLWLAQPSLRLDSAFSWTFTLQRPYLSLRYTGFVENGLTLLRGPDLQRFRSLWPQAGSGYGLDWALPQLLQAPRHKVAVLDEVACYHPPRQSALDQRWSRQQQAQQGELLCRQLGVQPLDPCEDGFVLNARGHAWVDQGATPGLVYAAAHRFVLHQMRAEIEKFLPRPGKASEKSKPGPC